jgi:glycosyltransferase involved in cell wall biosynthesis
MSSPLVSFIIPYFNAGTTIQETIDSIFNQSYPNFDVWLINDGSTDQFSIDKLKEFEGNDKIHLLHQENAGPSVAKNIGVQNAKGVLICFVDSDNILLNNYIKEAVITFDENPSIDVVYSDFEYFGDRLGIHKSNKIDSSTIFIGNSVDNCVVIRKTTFLSVKGFDSNLSKLGLEDWELWMNLLKNKKKFFYIEKIHFRYRVISTSRTNITANMNLIEIKKYIANKHSDFLAEIYVETYYKNKMTIESIDFRIGKFLLSPYRFIKKKLFRNE